MLQNKFFNEIRFKQLLGVVKNTRQHYRTAMCGKSIHPIIYDISRENNPIDWQQLILELPHMAKDGVSMGYYRDDRAVGVTITVTRLGKYVKRHFPTLADNVIRDYVNPYIINTETIDNIEDIISLMESDNVPGSCMSKSFNIHPYRVYDPKFGWKLILKKSGHQIVGRALVNNMHYVRAYTSSTSSVSGMSIDCALEAWLDSQGYVNNGKWPAGTKLARIENNCGEIVAPYIDGNNDNVNDHGDYLTICNDGEYECQNTSGTAESKNTCTCDICGSREAEDDLSYIENEGSVCASCIDSDFIYIESVRFNGYWTDGGYYRSNNCIQTIGGSWFPDDNYSDYGIVQLHNGEYTELDDTVYDEDTNEHYHTDDLGDKIAYCEDTEDYRTEFWSCEASNKYYSDNQEFAYDENGDKIHPDYASEELELVAEK